MSRSGIGASLLFISGSIFVFLFSGVSTAFGIDRAGPTTCENLVSLQLSHTTITAAQSIPGGTYTAPDGEVFKNMPAFCRVAATLAPTRDSEIGIEVWMPSSTWNGSFEGVGNGGYAGSIPYSAIAPGVSLGYATVGTDTGHVGSSTDDGSFALGHPEKIIDFGYRSIHLMTVIGKEIAAALYGGEPQRSYLPVARLAAGRP